MFSLIWLQHGTNTGGINWRERERERGSSVAQQDDSKAALDEMMMIGRQGDSPGWLILCVKIN